MKKKERLTFDGVRYIINRFTWNACLYFLLFVHTVLRNDNKSSEQDL